MRGELAGERRQALERGAFVGAMLALSYRIENEQDAPVIRHPHAGDHRRRSHRWTAPAVDHESAVMEEPDPGAGARAAIEPDGVTRDVEWKSVQPPDRGRNREGELCAGAEPRVGRNGVEDVHPVAAREAELAPHQPEIAFDAIALRPSDLGRLRALDRDARLQVADRDADAAEAAAERAVKIEKAEVQSCRDGNRHLDRVPRSDHLQASAPRFLSGAGLVPMQ